MVSFLDVLSLALLVPLASGEDFGDAAIDALAEAADLGPPPCEGEVLGSVANGCVSSQVCSEVAVGMGLQLGSELYPFEADYVDKGCFFFDANHPLYPGQAFFGTGGTCSQLRIRPSEGGTRLSCNGETQAPFDPDRCPGELCITSLACENTARAMGLQLGNELYPFEGDWLMKGCVYFPADHSDFPNQAYFGTGADICGQLRANPNDGSIRINCPEGADQVLFPPEVDEVAEVEEEEEEEVEEAETVAEVVEELGEDVAALLGMGEDEEPVEEEEPEEVEEEMVVVAAPEEEEDQEEELVAAPEEEEEEVVDEDEEEEEEEEDKDDKDDEDEDEDEEEEEEEVEDVDAMMVATEAPEEEEVAETVETASPTAMETTAVPVATPNLRPVPVVNATLAEVLTGGETVQEEEEPVVEVEEPVVEEEIVDETQQEEEEPAPAQPAATPEEVIEAPALSPTEENVADKNQKANDDKDDKEDDEDDKEDNKDDKDQDEDIPMTEFSVSKLEAGSSSGASTVAKLSAAAAALAMAWFL